MCSILCIFRAFQSVLSIVLNKDIGGFNENVVVHSFHDFMRSTSWLGFVMMVISGISGQVTGFFADRLVESLRCGIIIGFRFQKRFKIIICSLLMMAGACFLWFSLSVYGYGSMNPINLFITFCFGEVFVFTAMPIFYEAVIETTYPVAEGTLLIK